MAEAARVATAPRVAPRIVFHGEPGTYWTNETDFVQYQFLASMINTCGACLGNHRQISRWWGIPIHPECNCHQVAIKRGATSKYAFANYRELLDEMSHEQQVRCIGGANYQLLKKGLATWDDIVTKTRVRPLIQVVARNKITIKQMVDAGIRPDIARRAYETVHTPEADLIERQRRELLASLEPGSIAQQHLYDELAKRLAKRVVVAPPPSPPPPVAPVPVGPPPMVSPPATIIKPAPLKIWTPEPLSPAEPIPPRPAPPEAAKPRVDTSKLADMLKRTTVTMSKSGKVNVNVPKPEKLVPRPSIDTKLPEFKKHAADVRARTAGATEIWASEVSMTPKQYTSRPASSFKALVEQSDMYVRVKPAILRSVLADGRFKSQFETGQSGGLLDPGYRRDIEERVLGVPRSIPARERPIYGYFGAKEHGGYRDDTERVVAHYGSVSIRLKESVRARASVTAGDSLNRSHDVQASMAKEAGAASLGIGGHDWEAVHNAIFHGQGSAEALRAEIADTWYYIEAQYHGGLDVSHIADVVFASQPPPAVRATLDAKGIPWRVKK